MATDRPKSRLTRTPIIATTPEVGNRRQPNATTRHPAIPTPSGYGNQGSSEFGFVISRHYYGCSSIASCGGCLGSRPRISGVRMKIFLVECIPVREMASFSRQRLDNSKAKVRKSTSVHRSVLLDHPHDGRLPVFASPDEHAVRLRLTLATVCVRIRF